MRIANLAILVAVLLVLAACRPVTREGAAGAGASEDGGASGMETNALAGTNWTLATLNGEAVAAEPVLTLNFEEDGSASGSDGCNSFGATYAVDGDMLTFTPGAGTLMACPEPIMTQANAYMAALTSATTFTTDGETLTLLDASGATVATFTAVSSNLGGTSWQVTAFNNGNQAVVSVIEGTILTADFGADGGLSGSGGCNRFTTSYQSDGVSQITIDPPASTMMACVEPEGLMDQEMQYLTALATAATYTVEGNRLDLRTADDALAVSFVAATATAAEGATEGAAGGAAEGVADGAAGMASVTGAVTYLPRIALPADALVTVSIHNISLADAPPEMTNLATQAFITEGQQVPLPFELFYSPADVEEAALYSIGATIRSSGGDLLFVSKESIPVITQGNPTENVEILVSQP